MTATDETPGELRAADPVALTAELIRCPSVTPEEGGALALLEGLLAPAGFACHRISRGGVENLYARWGTGGPVFGFAGHTDVVPVGDVADWTADPFGGMEADGVLWGRGATDMKSGVGAFVAAALDFVGSTPPEGSVALLITGDEEGPAEHGTRAILDWMAENGEQLDFCLVGEPTSVTRLGDVVKIGRRGSMTAELTVFGTQGHTAYPDRATNPLPALAAACLRLARTPIDLGSTHFQASTLALTSIDTGNPASNVIPASATARFNIRFNDLHEPESIRIWVDQQIEEALVGTGCNAEIDWTVSGESFLTSPGPLTDIVVDAITDRLLERPALTTGGGTSDARFIKDHCPVVEFGLVGDTMHQVDERVPVADIRRLAELYGDILHRFFGR
ncbi:succinyl-diaminopimelate desuccinylase [Paralimibaculum aggregatum]|uniref:Succinyl-diaminopimelate desuccinylase n=1 Tax=Paralimibaculum aggregatum TaxID=3036245 RepID=A0ABQ6LRC7_9RHOB|nr:succinyl-diaminopimelate desuccinylase [Limibaculum sp. NKW23]GMG83864.1 succinyl-diaminopimelate desuccinylase [Limibaculum sp. NKW23]